jgi:hypothetical protein
MPYKILAIWIDDLTAVLKKEDDSLRKVVDGETETSRIHIARKDFKVRLFFAAMSTTPTTSSPRPSTATRGSTSTASPPTSRTQSSDSRNIAKGATARSAVSPRVNAALSTPTRRSSLRASAVPQNGDISNMSNDALAASLKKETEEKEEVGIFHFR